MTTGMGEIKAAAAAISADWRSSAVMMGVMDGKRGVRAAIGFPNIRGWNETYNHAFAWGANSR